MNDLEPIESSQIKPYQETYFDLVEKFLMLSDIGQNTKKLYRKVLRYWYEWNQENNITSPTKEHVLVYKNTLNSKSKYTQATYLNIIKTFYDWLDNEKYYPNITKGIKVKNRSADKHTRSGLTQEEAMKLLDSIDTTTIAGVRDYIMINLMVRTGLRMIEVNRANVNDLYVLNSRNILYVQGKGRTHKDEFVILTDDAYKPLIQYLELRGVDKDVGLPLFVSHSVRNSVNVRNDRRLTVDAIRWIVWTCLKEAGLKRQDIVGHSLRHSTATLAIDAGALLEEVQALMRHADPRTTMIYIKNRDRFKNAAEDKIKI